MQSICVPVVLGSKPAFEAMIVDERHTVVRVARTEEIAVQKAMSAWEKRNGATIDISHSQD